LFFVLLSSGTSIGAIASGVFAETFGFPSVFFVAAAANVAAGVLVIVAVGKQRGSRAPTSDDPIGAPEVIRLPRPPLLVLAAVAVFGAAASQASQIFIPLLMTEHAGIPIDHVGYAYGLTGLVGILLLMLAGGLTDLIGRKFVVVVALSLVAAGDAGLSYARTFMTIVSCMLAAQIGLYMLLPPIVTLLSRISPPRNQLRSQGLFTLVLNVGFTIGALTSGWIWGLEGPTATYLYAAVLALIAWVVAVTLIDETRWLGSARTGPPVSLR
jgi:predicted MFS family arabinose efflux permease